MSDAAGLYVHVPFCLTRCGYCDFNTYAGLDELKPGYLDALGAEASRWAPEWADVSFDSVFLGGGTPTTLAPDALAGLLDALRAAFRIQPGAEVTVEANPDTVDAASLSALRAAGVTRLSIGAQSFDARVLASLERVHQPSSVVWAFTAAREAGHDDVNLDLIYGAEGETPWSWRTTLERTVELGPEHVSAYALTVEPNTMLGHQVASGQRPAPDPDLQADLYAMACEVLGGAGYEHYEVSNWALPGRACRHNLGYWRRQPYLGLGAGSHSFRGRRRWWNLRPPQGYVDAVASGELPVAGDETLDHGQERFERIFLGLRAAAVGIPTADVEDAVDLGDDLVTRRGDRFVATEQGMFLANDLALALVG